jgi:hypothetical protein
MSIRRTAVRRGGELDEHPAEERDRPMQYMFLIYGDEKHESSMSPADQGKLFADYMAFSKELKASGKGKGGDALKPTPTATTVRVRNGKRATTDGPFAETKEQLGGYYIIDCKDLDEALEWAAKIPSATYGSIEVRPVMIFDQPMT